MPASRERPVDAADFHAPHKAHTGHRWFDIAMTLAAFLVSSVSLYMGIDNGKAMEKLVAANSWPNVRPDVSIDDGKEPGTLRFVVTVANRGVGPALVETLEFWVGDKPIANSAAMIRHLKERAAIDQPTPGRVEGASVVGGFLGAKESHDLLAFTPTADPRWFAAMLRTAEELRSRVCYCSVFDECYVADSRAENARPKPVDNCPKPEVAFRDSAIELLPNLVGSSPTAPSASAK